jgi:hypothetical protein
MELLQACDEARSELEKDYRIVDDEGNQWTQDYTSLYTPILMI